METATHPRSAVPKALEFKAFPVLNVLRCAAAGLTGYSVPFGRASGA